MGYWIRIPTPTTLCRHNKYNQRGIKMKMDIKTIAELLNHYETISIQTRQITVKDLTKDKIKYFEEYLVLTINSKEDVIINVNDIKAVYGRKKQ